MQRRSQEEALRRALNFGLEAGRARSGCWGINGKLPEVSAAVGLAVLRTFETIIRHRRTAAQVYIQLLSEYNELNFPTEARLSPWQVFPGPAPVGPGGGGIYRAGCGAEPASPLELQANPGLLAAHEQERTVAECGVTLPADGDVAGLLRYKRE